MRDRLKSLGVSLFLLVIGLALWSMTTVATEWRFPKAEAAGYLFTVIGVLATCVTAYRAVRYVRPLPGCLVHFWGPDGRTKLVGRVIRVNGTSLVVETDSAELTLSESAVLSTQRPPA